MEIEMQKSVWVQAFPASITVCDVDGVILEMNDGSIKEFKKYGGADLIGKNLIDCHSKVSGVKLKEMLATQQPNIYSIEKHGKKQLVYQHPWYKDGVYSGFVEIILTLPQEVPNFNR
jgi:hypothetical protein